MHAETAYLFRHALMREAAYQLHPPADRAALHKLALEVLEQLLSPEALSELAEELADHAADAQAAAADTTEARDLARRQVRYLIQAGENAAARYEADGAVSLLTRAAQHPQCDEASRFRALVAAGNTRIVEGRFEPARQLLQQVNPDSLGAADRAAWRLRMAEVDLRTARYPQVLQLAALAVQDARSVGHGAFEARALAMQASANMLAGRLDEALVQYEETLALAQAVGDAAAAAQAEVNRASVLRKRGRHTEAEAILRRALTEFAKAGPSRNLAIAQQNLSNVMYDQRRMEEAELWLNTAEATYRRVGDRNGIANITGSRGIQYHYERDYEKAARAYREAAELFSEIGAPRGEMRNWANLGTALLQMGRVEEAAAMAERALALARQIGDRESQGIYIGQRGSAHKLAGRPKPALADIQASVDISDREMRLRNAQVVINYCHLCDLLHQLGDPAGAQQAADRARAIRQEMPPDALTRDPDAQPALEALKRYPAAQVPRDPT